MILDGVRYLRPHIARRGKAPTLDALTPRQRWWLYEGLRAHTRDSVPWQRLEDWQRQWNRCVDYLKGMRCELEISIQKATGAGSDNDLHHILDDVVQQVWGHLLEGNLRPPADGLAAGVAATEQPNRRGPRGTRFTISNRLQARG